jgi:hypothetical protein
MNRKYIEHREFKSFQLKTLISNIELDLKELENLLEKENVLRKNKIQRIKKMFFEIALRLD